MELKICLYGIPLAFLLLVVLMVRVFFLPGAMDGVIMMARPDLEQMMDPSMWSRAAGMALFAIGLWAFLPDGVRRYLPEKSNIPMDFLAVASCGICLAVSLPDLPSFLPL